MMGDRRRARSSRLSWCRRSCRWRQPVPVAAPRHRRSDGRCRMCRRCHRRGRRRRRRRPYRRCRHRPPWTGCHTTTRTRRPTQKSSSISVLSPARRGLGRSETPPAGRRCPPLRLRPPPVSAGGCCILKCRWTLLLRVARVLAVAIGEGSSATLRRGATSRGAGGRRRVATQSATRRL